MSQKVALIIGNSEYKDPKLSQLVTPGQDVLQLAEVLRAPQMGGFDHVQTLLNKPEATVRREIARLFGEKKKDDMVLLYFSGHGVLSAQGLLYLAFEDTEYSLLEATAIPAAYIRNIMDISPSRRQILILDCCNSAAFARGTKGALGTTVGTATTFESTGYGRVVLTATDSTQYAWEGEQVIGKAELSVFTHYLIEGLETGEADADGDGLITLDELYDYVHDQVVRATPKQTPAKFAEKQLGKFVIARNPRPPLQKVSLPDWMAHALANIEASGRIYAVRELHKMLQGDDPQLVGLARIELERLVQKDEDPTVRREAASALKVPSTAESTPQSEVSKPPNVLGLGTQPTTATKPSEPVVSFSGSNINEPRPWLIKEYNPKNYCQVLIRFKDENRVLVRALDNRELFGPLRMDRQREKLISMLDTSLSEDITKVGEDKLELLGTGLYEALFNDEVRKVFEEVLNIGWRERDVHLGLVLEFMPEAYNLAQLPWECMYFARNDDWPGRGFLADRTKISITRKVQNSIFRNEESKPYDPLKIMIVHCDADSLGKVSPDATEDILKRFGDKVTPYMLRQPTQDSFFEGIHSFKPDILHLICHGHQDDRRNRIPFTSDLKRNEVYWTDVKFLASHFSECNTRLIFLTTPGTSNFNRDFAFRLAHSSTCAVVTMQYPLTNKLSEDFIEEFYLSLLEGEPVDWAVRRGRRTLQGRPMSRAAFVSPMAYMHSRNPLVSVRHEKSPLPPPDTYPSSR